MKASTLNVPKDDTDLLFIPVRHCPKCGGMLDSSDECVDCLFSEETRLSQAEAREFTCAGD